MIKNLRNNSQTLPSRSFFARWFINIALASIVIFSPVRAFALDEFRVDTSGLSSKLTPGDSLPITVKLSNFGGGKRVDITIAYTIVNSQNHIIYSETETVALETTASFVKILQIPSNAAPGQYQAKASMTYQGQVVPAITDFPFTVENKFLGLFPTELAFYLSIVVAVAVITAVFGRLFVKKLRVGRLQPFDYSNIPRGERVFYELISDTVLEMRQKVGEAALDIAADIDGLTVDKKSGRVLKIAKSPSKIIADLVSGYEKSLGLKVSFSFRS